MSRNTTIEKELTHIDLFSGIGGFTLAGEWAGFKTVAFCEKEEFCQKVLKKRFGAVIADSEYLRKLQSEGSKQNKWERTGNFPVLIPEIRDFDGTKYRGATLLTGGFPCQPFSVAGQRRGKEDDRYLWPEMLRVIDEAKPHWILAENVPGIFRMALDTVLADLESKGYVTGTFIIPACGLNAPHRRNRVWIVANDKKPRLEGKQSRAREGMGSRPELRTQDAPNSEGRMPGKQAEQKRWENSGGRNIEINANSSIQRLEGAIRQVEQGYRGRFASQDRGQNWQEDWHEVAARFCRVDDGVPDRVHRLKALGNAIVPQIAYEILRNIAWIENELA